jgi:hypothetical protein
MKFDLEKYKLLLLLLIADIVFIILHIVYRYTDLLPSSLFSLSRDRGYAEFFQYTKELWIAILLLILGIKQRRGLFTAFSFLFLYFLTDDSIELHEGMGKFFADFLNFQPAFGLRAVDFGEVLVSAFFGLLFFGSIAIFYYLSERPERKIAQSLIGLILLMALFGILLDMIEVMTTHPATARVLTIIEEGGEMVVMSIIAWFVFGLKINNRMDAQQRSNRG